MSQPRYASITASLLARKGEAQPWAEAAKQPLAWERGELPAAAAAYFRYAQSPRVAPAAQASHSAHAAPAPQGAPAPHAAHDPESAHPHGPADWKKISVRMSHHDYERLGILAVKQDKTRQRLLHEALDRLLAGITLKYSTGCACLGAEE
jgi:hypothetical protein